jgi:hypothetical protein
LNCDDFEIFQCAAKAETERKGVSGERERERRGRKQSSGVVLRGRDKLVSASVETWMMICF